MAFLNQRIAQVSQKLVKIQLPVCIQTVIRKVTNKVTQKVTQKVKIVSHGVPRQLFFPSVEKKKIAAQPGREKKLLHKIRLLEKKIADDVFWGTTLKAPICPPKEDSKKGCTRTVHNSEAQGHFMAFQTLHSFTSFCYRLKKLRDIDHGHLRLKKSFFPNSDAYQTGTTEPYNVL